ncbi:MAG: HAMP domain-containing histidine kinase [Rubrivivax sp.]|nr:HAMP domain-containing histidine kinase [Rubrivivax sp.]
MRLIARPVTLARHTLGWLVALYAALLLAAMAAAMVFVMWPMGQRAADDLAALMQLSAQTWTELPPETRPAFVDELRRSHRLSVAPARTAFAVASTAAPPRGFYVQFLERALAQRQGRPAPLWRGPGPDDGDWLWVRLQAGGQALEVGFDYARLRTRPASALGSMLLAAALLLGPAAWWLARRIAEPVRRLERAAAELAQGRDPQPLPETGPLELARLAGHFNQMAAQVHELLQARTALLAVVSHDLRTPLARMRLALEMQRLKPDPSQLARIEQDIEAMDTLIGRMLEVARGIASSEAAQPLVLRGWLEERARAHAALAQAQGAAITVDCPAALTLAAPPQALGRVVDNLLLNALRHAPGPVTLSARASDAGVRIEVADRGPGIAPDQLEAVWQPFRRLDASRSPATGGWGLGLTIVQQLARSHGWTVALRNREGGGLVATLVLGVVAREA